MTSFSRQQEAITVVQHDDDVDQKQQQDVDNTSKVEKDNIVIIKEDDWGLAMDFTLFAHYERQKIKLASSSYFEMECVESLTPLDMMYLMNGIHDATGHCIWTGSFYFLSCLPTLQQEHQHVFFANKRVLELGTGTGIAGIGLLLSSSQQSEPPKLLCLTDADPNALELCRRNIQINHNAILRTFKSTTTRNATTTTNTTTTTNATTSSNSTTDDGNNTEQQQQQSSSAHVVPPSTETLLSLENEPASSLLLCDDRLTVETLTWQTDPVEFSSSSNNMRPHCFDTVIAADILYDIEMLPAILQTARACLKQPSQRQPSHRSKQKSRSSCSTRYQFDHGGSDDDDECALSSSSSSSSYFILSHVPRACYTSQHPAPSSVGITTNSLQDYIIHQAKCFGNFDLLSIIHPFDLLQQQQQQRQQENDDKDKDEEHNKDEVFLNNMSLQDMHEIGACLFIFQTRSTLPSEEE